MKKYAETAVTVPQDICNQWSDVALVKDTDYQTFQEVIADSTDNPVLRSACNCALAFVAALQQKISEGQALSKELITAVWQDSGDGDMGFIATNKVGAILKTFWLNYADVRDKGLLPEKLYIKK